MKNLNQFTGLYPLSKTLRFELKPIGKTLENIKESGLLDQDEHRADSYVEVKDIIDNYHKALIERILASLSFKNEEEEKIMFEKLTELGIDVGISILLPQQVEG